MTSRLLQRARIAYPFLARRNKRGIVQNQQYIVREYTLYEAREACDLCHREHQAGRQVLIGAGDRDFRAGLDCLEDVSGITRRALELAVQGHLGVALRLRNLSPQGYGDEREMLSQIEGLIDRIAFNREAQGVRTEVQRLRTLDHFGNCDLRWLEEAVDHIALVDLMRRDPARAGRLLEAVFGHPGRARAEGTSPLDRAQFEDVKKLSLQQSARLRAVMKLLLAEKPRVRWNEAVLPWAFADQEGYRRALAAHYQTLADTGQGMLGRLQQQYDLVHHGPLTLRAADIVTNVGVPLVLPVYQHDRILALQLNSAGTRRLMELGNHLPRSALDGQWTESRVVHRATVRTDRPEDRRRSANVEDTQEVIYRCLAWWRPDSWHGIYALWLAHGQEQLMTFPALER